MFPGSHLKRRVFTACFVVGMTSGTLHAYLQGPLVNKQRCGKVLWSYLQKPGNAQSIAPEMAHTVLWDNHFAICIVCSTVCLYVFE